ncbi:MAG: AsmA family protein [Alphaproteobacteria bacterium]|nr:AsmA family protein [Alphaproteobacteria bacterium]
MKVRRSKFFLIAKILGLFVLGLIVAIFVTLSHINLESLRGNLLTILQDATGMPVEIDGAVSWKFSLRPRVELNKVRVANESWATSKYAFSADKIDVRLNLISLFQDKPTIQNVRVYDAEVNIEKNVAGQYSIRSLPQKQEAEKDGLTSGPEKYPFKDFGMGGVEVRNLKVNILGEKYSLAGFHVRLMEPEDGLEYSGWIKADKNVLPFIIKFSEYNPDRRVYPVQIALSTGGDALIANVALEGTSRAPIDFIVKGEIPYPERMGELLGLNLDGVPAVRLNVAGGFDREKVTLRKSLIGIDGVDFTISGDWDWSDGTGQGINASLYSPGVDLMHLFPDWYFGSEKNPNRKLNVFKDIPLFGEMFVGRNLNLQVRLGKLVLYRDLELQNLDVRLDLRDNRARLDGNLDVAQGNVNVGIDAKLEEDGHIWLQAASIGKNVTVGDILRRVHNTEFLSDLPMDFEFYVRANGKNLAQVMKTLTGPVRIYSVAPGYAHSALVSYIYGADFLTSLRHSVQDLFNSEKKYNQIEVSCVAVNAVLRNGLIETQNGVAVETNTINMNLAGTLDLGNEEMKLSLTTVPVRGLKLSLTGNVVNSIELTGSLAEPSARISGAAVAGKVASATGLGMLLAPFTGGIGLVAGAGIGLVAGDLLENWLADGNPCETAMERGAPLYRDDPEWLKAPLAGLIDSVLKTN